MKTLCFLFLIGFQTLAHTEFYHGDWMQNCTVVNEDDVIKNMILIDKVNIDRVTFAYEEENCHSAYLIFKRSYKVVADQSETSSVIAQIEKVSYTSLTDEVTEALNLISYCGEKNWQTMKEKIVTGKTCGDYEAPKQGSSETIQFSKKNSSELLVDDDPTPFYRLIP